MTVAGLVLAGGAGRRFAPAIKQLAHFDGKPLVSRAVTALQALDLVVVVVGAHAEAVSAAIDPDAAQTVRCADWASGQSASLRAGVRATLAAGAEAVVVTLCDQPLVGARAAARVLAARPGAGAVRVCYRGVPGHPVLLDLPLLEAVASLRGDQGARALLGGARLVECDDIAVPEDVDTPAALARLAAQHPSTPTGVAHRPSTKPLD